ncbi:18987_t:CDS:2 [Funneliformis geosporum]|uniref:12424_t:CDS:1 n=1 Tax=Funneliformis geosporum TaxID=1117311 RepID=A0A9W4SIP8_9GLOM|nr:18987_t:CDS:2 [Funneliformis geosporum]CAI2169936.1 12424_t:CDS:2 [Funneliformis geosporum]
MEISSDRHSQFLLDPPINYRLEVAQQPIRARMCGFGDKDRRPIDPPPVVKLLVSTADGTHIPEGSVDHSMMIVHAALWSENCIDERSLVINPSSIPSQSTGTGPSSILSLNAPSCTRNLMGHCTSSAYVLTDDLGQQGIYFIFQDLSVRTEGSFTLKFSFCDVKGLLTRRGSVAAEVYSGPFKVYTAKKFPGMTESTELSKAFAKQGIKIPIRKDTRYRKEGSRDPSIEVVPQSSSSVAVPAKTLSDSEAKVDSTENDEKRNRHDLSDDDADSEGGKDKSVEKRRRKSR